MEELRAVTEKDAGQKGMKARRALGPGTLEIGGIEGRGAGNGAVMLGVLAERPEKGRQGAREAATEVRGDGHRVASLGEEAPLPEG